MDSPGLGPEAGDHGPGMEGRQTPGVAHVPPAEEAAGEERLPEAGPEVGGHEAVDEGVETGVEIRQEVEGLSQRFEVPVVKLTEHAGCYQHVVDQHRAPTNGEEQHDDDQHLHHLKHPLNSAKLVS